MLAPWALAGCTLDGLPYPVRSPGSGTDGGVTMDALADTGGPACAAGQTSCGGHCVNMGTDVNNCGACGSVCASGTVCNNGACVTGCPVGTVPCGSECKATSTDPANCGACGRVCAAGTTCTGAACASICATGQTYCAGTCVSTATDVNNCGACGRVCPGPTAGAGGLTCTAGECRITCIGATSTLCGAGCYATAIDPANCGSCGHACASGTACTAGTCTRSTSTQPSCPVPSERGCGAVAIPGGTFTMGGDPGANYDTPAAGTITVGGFALDSYEVTVSRFRRFWAAGHPAAPATVTYPGGTVTTGGGVTEPDTSTYCTWSEVAGSLEAHPINCVDSYTAQSFCVWDGGRLPTEAEWEYAARGTSAGGLAPERFFPWGNTPPSATCDLAEWDGCPADDCTGTKRVGSFAPSAGLYDLAGNVWEWTADWYADYTDPTCWNGGSRADPVCNNSSAAGYRAVRGGSWVVTSVAYLRSASRGNGTASSRVYNVYVGFRCARSAP